VSIRLVLADDHAQFRAYLAALLAQQPGIEVVAEAEDGEAAVRAVQALAGPRAPQLVVMDVEMRGGGGIAATRRLLAACPRVAVLALSMHDEPAFVAAMLDAGALGYVLKGEPLAELLQAIRAVAAGRRHVGRPLGTSGNGE
jgi:DNA-binding NarL/FixJ family response regulator